VHALGGRKKHAKEDPMTRLTTLTALWALGDLSLTREEGKLFLPEEATEEVFQAIRPHKARVLAALEDGEEVPARVLLEDPAAWSSSSCPRGRKRRAVSLAVYREEEPHRYLAPPGHLAPFLLWSARHEPAPRRVWVGGAHGKWSLDVETPLEAALEVSRPLPHTLAGPAWRVERYLHALHEATALRALGGRVTCGGPEGKVARA
jgi:hypothetical protein